MRIDFNRGNNNGVAVWRSERCLDSKRDRAVDRELGRKGRAETSRRRDCTPDIAQGEIGDGATGPFRGAFDRRPQ